MRGQADGEKGGAANPSCHLPNSSITFLISLFLSLLHFGCQVLSLNCITVSLLNFSPVPSLSLSIIFLHSIPSPSFIFLFLPSHSLTICLSHQIKILHSHPTLDSLLLLKKRNREYIQPKFSDLCVMARKYIIMTA